MIFIVAFALKVPFDLLNCAQFFLRSQKGVNRVPMHAFKDVQSCSQGLKPSFKPSWCYRS